MEVKSDLQSAPQTAQRNVEVMGKVMDLKTKMEKRSGG